MSLNVKTIHVGDREFTLRLTSKALLNYNQKHGQEATSPLVAVLQAVEDLDARIDLLSNALNHPENKNSLKDGGTLLDLMADDYAWSNAKVNELILTLAHESGLLDEDDYLSLIDPVAENGKKLISTLSNLLTGNPVGGNAEGTSETGAAENPT